MSKQKAAENITTGEGEFISSIARNIKSDIIFIFAVDNIDAIPLSQLTSSGIGNYRRYMDRVFYQEINYIKKTTSKLYFVTYEMDREGLDLGYFDENAIKVKDKTFLNGEKIHLRANSDCITFISEKIKEEGGILTVSTSDLSTIFNWDLWVGKEFKKRKTRRVVLKDLIKNVNDFKDLENNNNKVFVKAIQKNISSVINTEEVSQAFKHELIRLPENSSVMVSEIIDIDEDFMGKKEFRVTVAAKKIISISRHNYEKEPCDIPRGVFDFIDTFIKKNKLLDVKYYTIDVAMLSSSSFVIVKVNNIGTSVRYSKNLFEPLYISIVYNESQ